jgi:hypothetical protein
VGSLQEENRAVEVSIGIFREQVALGASQAWTAVAKVAGDATALSDGPFVVGSGGYVCIVIRTVVDVEFSNLNVVIVPA